MRWLAVPAMASALTLGCSEKEDGEARSATGSGQVDAGEPRDPTDGGTTPDLDGGPCDTSDAGGPVPDAGTYDPSDGGPFDPSDAGGFDPSDAGPYDPSDAGNLDRTGSSVY